MLSNLSFSKIYTYLFQHSPSKNAREFFQNSFWSLGGGTLAFAFLFLANILAGRWLGPEEFGKYSLTIAWTNILAILFVLDTDTGITHFIARAATPRERKKYLTNSLILAWLIYLLIFIFILLFFQIALWFFPLITASWLKLSLWILFLSTLIAGKRTSEAMMRGLKKFRYQALAKLVEGIIVLIILILTIQFLNLISFTSYLAALIIGGVILLVLYGKTLKNLINFSLFSLNTIREIFRYSRYGIINSFTSIAFKSFDKIIIAGMLGTYQLGIYSAYYTVSILLSARLIQMLINVYFPTISGLKNKRQLIKKVDRFLIKLSFPLFLGYILSVRFLLMLFGHEYPVHWIWINLIGLYFIFHLTANLYGWILAASSHYGFRYQNIGSVLNFLIFVLIIYFSWQINNFSITWLFLALAIAKIILVIFYIIALKFLSKKSTA